MIGVSIIIPIKNDKVDLIKTINSLQLIKHIYKFEIIVVDGGIVQSLTEVDSIYKHVDKYITAIGTGIYEAMNIGVKSSIYDYCYFCGAGDIITQFPSLNINDKIIYCNVFMGERKVKFRTNLNWLYLYNSLHHQGLIYSKNLIYYNQNYKILADYDLNLRLIKSNTNIRFDSKCDIAIIKPHGVSNNFLGSLLEGYKVFKNNNITIFYIAYLIVLLISKFKNQVKS